MVTENKLKKLKFSIICEIKKNFITKYIIKRGF